MRPGSAHTGVHPNLFTQRLHQPFSLRAVVSTPHANFFGPYSASGVSRTPPAAPAFDRSAYLPARAREAYERVVGGPTAAAHAA